MVIHCTNCKAKFKIPDSKIKKDETKVRCAKCGQIFVAKIGENAFAEDEQVNKPEAVTKPIKDKPSVEKNVAFSEEALFGSEDLMFDEDTQAKKAPSSAGEKDSESAISEMASELEKHIQEEQGPVVKKEEDSNNNATNIQPTREDVKKEKQDKIPKKKLAGPKTQRVNDGLSRKWIAILYPVVIVGTLITGLVLAGLSPSLKNVSLVLEGTPDVLKKGINVIEAKSELLKTASGFELFAIQGELYNNAEKIARDVVLEGELFTGANRFIVKEKFDCCVSISRLALREISDIKSLLSSSDFEKVSEIPSYSSLKFTLVYPKPEEPVNAFRINILNDEKK